MNSIVGRFSAFVGVGAVATAVQYIVLVLLVAIFRLPAVLSSTIGFAVSAALNYFLNYHLTFESKAAHTQTALRFASMALTGLGLNAFLMTLLSTHLGLHYLLAQVLSSGLVLIWNFTLSQYWIFRNRT